MRSNSAQSGACTWISSVDAAVGRCDERAAVEREVGDVAGAVAGEQARLHVDALAADRAAGGDRVGRRRPDRSPAGRRSATPSRCARRPRSRLRNSCVSVSAIAVVMQALVEVVEPDADAVVQELRLLAAAGAVPQLERLEVMEEVAAARDRGGSAAGSVGGDERLRRHQRRCRSAADRSGCRCG